MIAKLETFVADARRADAPAGMLRIPGGSFRMGSDYHCSEERPAHRVTVSPFWMGSTTITNADFACFVAATGQMTLAERPLGARAMPPTQMNCAVRRPVPAARRWTATATPPSPASASCPRWSMAPASSARLPFAGDAGWPRARRRWWTPA
jgi:formylglycine-generating enzyme required for sulfatase activity